MKQSLIFLLFLFVASCKMTSEPGVKYSVEVLSVETLNNNPSNYCVYRIKCLDCCTDCSPLKILPRPYFVDKCGNYAAGAQTAVEMNDNN